MKTTTQTLLAHGKQVVHSNIFGIQRPSDSVLSMLIGQGTQTFVQSSSLIKFGHTHVERSITRCRGFFHDVGVLSVSAVNSSLNGQHTQRKEQNQLFVWNCKSDGGSNA